MQQPSTSLPQASNENFDAREFCTPGYRNAIERLHSSFDQSRPVQIVIGEGRLASSFVVSRFLAGLDADTAVARITRPCADAAALMRQIVKSVGFDPKDMGVADLQSVLRMFLSFQKGHARRTVICLEQIQDSEWWVLDRIRQLVDLEVRGKFGLMLVLTGQPGLQELLHTRPLNSVCLHAGQRIALMPLTIEETTEYIRRRVAGAPRASIDQAFHFQAVTRIQEVTAGVPDTLSELVSLCFELADESGIDMITADVVNRARTLQQTVAPQLTTPAETVTVKLNGLQPRAGRLLVQMSGEQIQEMTVRHGHILIGRSKLCDIRVASTAVSRYHALISHTPEGVMLVDLGSTNGTCVDGVRIQSHCLAAGETITLGDCRIEYLLDDERQAQFLLAGKRTLQNLADNAVAAEFRDGRK
ncbi:MAG: FHA domain-containing protein [Gammaproteobacteria bacterium]|nr:FHA domain-containing protein [Gammaproteobacteria bacterium]MDH5303119.1 FHA domain-containing protein [Gammaproteobacteria bacterium]MDH5322159.1 FHA domain-containing protein [Gammaproteobacteria bacterium]